MNEIPVYLFTGFMDSGKTYPVFYHGQNKISDIFLHIRFPCNTLLKI